MHIFRPIYIYKLILKACPKPLHSLMTWEDSETLHVAREWRGFGQDFIVIMFSRTEINSKSWTKCIRNIYLLKISLCE